MYMKSFFKKSWLPNRLLMVAMFITCTGSMVAQEENAQKEASTTANSFSLVYIAQDASMPIQEIEKKLMTAWNRSVQDGPTIFYLSRGRENPIIVKVNTEKEDNRDDYDNVLIPAIKQDIPYSVDGPHDKQRLLELLRENAIVAPDGTPLYKETYFDFHVGQDFWTAGYNESVIAALFFELDIKKHIADNFHFNVFCPRSIKYNEDTGPFGLLNPDDCRRNINLDRSY